MADQDQNSSGSNPPVFKDITLYDKDTGEPFVFTAKEQEFFAKQGFKHVPAHSPKRRKLLREQRYKGNTIYNVICMQCKRVGKITQKPPKPKQVLCEDCFNAKWSATLSEPPRV